MYSKRIVTGLLACMMIVFLFAACAQKEPVSSSKGTKETSKKEVKLLLYHGMPEMSDWFTNFAKDFNATHSGIVLEQETQKDASTLQVKYAAGEDPDILAGSVVSQQYMDLDKYADLTPHTEWLNRIDENLIKSVTDVKTGKLFRMPMCKSTAGLFYNKKIFEELGLKEAQTWDEFLNNLRTIKKQKPDVIPWYVFGTNYGHQTYFFVHGLRQMDIGSFETQKAVSLNDSSVLQFDAPGSYVEKYAERLLQVQKEGLIDNEVAITGTAATANEAFATGKAAIITSGTWWLGGAVKQFPKIKEFVSLAPIPSIVDGRKPYTTASQDSSIAISAASKYQDEIVVVLNELFKPENMKSYSETRGAPSSFNDVKSNWSSISEKVADNWNKYDSVAHVLLPNGFALSDVDKLGQELMVGAYNPQEFAAEFTKRWNKASSNNK